MAPEERQRVRDNVRQLLEDGIHRDREYAFLRPDGSRFPVDAARRVVGYQPQDDAHVLWARLAD